MSSDKLQHDPTSCSQFFDLLEHWLSDELDEGQNRLMLDHHNACADCRLEARLARQISVTTASLPELQYPQLHHSPPVKQARDVHAAKDNLLNRLLNAWREPLVLVPAFALVLAVSVFMNIRDTPDTGTNQALVEVDGQYYTQEEIIQAAQELELALQYLNRYSSVPAKVVQTELKSGLQPLQTPLGSDDDNRDPI